MNLISLNFLIFFLIFFFTYYLIPRKFRYIPILIGSYFFYCFHNVKYFFILLPISIITYLGGLFIYKMKNKVTLFFFILLNVSFLVIFKYTNFILENIRILNNIFKWQEQTISSISIFLPIGLSFITFQSITYLTDVYYGRIKPDRNFFMVGAFVAFFPTILSGPIQKARILLPQLKKTLSFQFDTARKAILFIIWGIFEKVVIANSLSKIVSIIYGDYLNYNGFYYIIAILSFSIYIYADFSSYSDLARGIALLLGIDVGKNFNNPYLSTSFSEFWGRWHISLNNWFLENIYIPLGGNRKGKLRKYLNIFIVFFISGIWHGASYHFLVWGIINGLLVILEQMFSSLNKSKKQPSKSILYLKRVFVFSIISLTWIFFYNSLQSTFYILRHTFNLSIVELFNPELFKINGTFLSTFILILYILIFCKIQLLRQNVHKYFQTFIEQPIFLQCLCLSIFLTICIFFILSPDFISNTQFIYYEF